MNVLNSCKRNKYPKGMQMRGTTYMWNADSIKNLLRYAWHLTGMIVKFYVNFLKYQLKKCRCSDKGLGVLVEKNNMKWSKHKSMISSTLIRLHLHCCEEVKVPYFKRH